MFRINNNETVIKEKDIREQYPEALETLLRDHTTQQNIFWVTDNYLGENYTFNSPILAELITVDKGNESKPRVQKDKHLQQSRVRSMPEVFTPSWICNAQNNLIDNARFGRESVFTAEITNSDGLNTWIVNPEKITLPGGKTWKQYVRDTRMEMTCGDRTTQKGNLFGKTIITKPCEGSKTDNMHKHNGVHCIIKDLSNKGVETGQKGRRTILVELIKRK